MTGDQFHSLSYRKATVEDAEALGVVFAEALAICFPKENSNPGRKAQAAKTRGNILKTELLLPNHKTLVAVENNEPVGYLMHRMKRGGYSLEIEEFYVSKPHDHIGRDLFGNFCKSLSEAVDIHIQQSDYSQPIYAKFGFKKNGREMLLTADRVQEWRDCPEGTRPDFK